MHKNCHILSSYKIIKGANQRIKIFENMLSKQMTRILNQMTISLRTNLALGEKINSWSNRTPNSGFKKKYFVGTVLFNLKKAFDWVSSKLLISNLEHHGLNNKSCNLVASFLTNRYQFVVWDSDVPLLDLASHKVHS